MNLPLENVYATIAAVLLFGLPLGYLAKKVHLPSITGNIVAGMLLGPVLGVVDPRIPAVEAQLEPITSLALSLIAISIGSHLKLTILRNALRRILIVAGIEVLVLPLLVSVVIFVAMMLGGYSGAQLWHVALFMGILSMATAPATVIHVVKEAQAKGVLVKTLVAVVVFNNAANIFLFEVARRWVFGGSHGPLGPIFQLVGSIALGLAVALILLFAWRALHSKQRMITLSFGALMILYGCSLQLDLSPVLANLTLGIAIANLSERNRLLDIFEDFEEMLYALFFTLMGTHVHFEHVGSVGILAALYFFCRVGGNLATVWMSGRWVRLPVRVRRYLGLCLTPQAGITVGLIATLEAAHHSTAISQYVIPAVLLAVACSEIIGPPIVRLALRRSGEEGQALPRLIDFLQEETITTTLRSTHRQGIIEELVDLLYKTHPTIRKLDRKGLIHSLLEREQMGGTGVGNGIAIPHARILSGSKIMGVMGILRDGVDWQARDGRPVHMVVLLATPPGQERRHLKVIATITRLFRRRSVEERGIHLAHTPAEVYEALTDGEFESLNQVVEQELGIDVVQEVAEKAMPLAAR
ncbi:MAG: cation:proton antiporter [Parachlamydiales bacterium]